MKQNNIEARQILIIVYVVVLACALFIGFGAPTWVRGKPQSTLERRVASRIAAINDETKTEVQTAYAALEERQRAINEQIKQGNVRTVWPQVVEIDVAFYRLFERHPEYFPYLRTEEQQLWMPWY